MKNASTTGPSPFRVAAAMSAARDFATKLQAELAELAELDDDSFMLALDSETNVLDVLRQVVRASIEADSLADMLAARIAELQQRRARYQARHASARGTVAAMMSALGETRFEDAEFTLSLREGKPRAVVTDLAALPEELVRVKREPNMTAINAAVAAGTVPPGVEMSNGGGHILTVKTR